jgi:membrane associated rhomboid family serine protease
MTVSGTDPDKQPVRPSDHPMHKPALNLHTAVITLIAILCAVHFVPPMLLANWGDWSAFALAFIPARFGQEVQLPQLPGSAYWTMLTHGFLHGNFAHLAANCVWLLAFGTPLARALGGARFFLIAAVSTIAGALATLATHWAEFIILVGASGGISGMLGALIPIMFADRGFMQIRSDRSPDAVSRLPLASLFTNGKALAMMGNVFVVSLITGVAQSFSTNALIADANIAWEAHLGGFFAGLIMIYLMPLRRASQT